MGLTGGGPAELGRYIKALRAKAGLTQDEVSARLVGFDRTYISQLERGRVRLPSYEARRQLAAIFGVSPVDFLVYAGEVTAAEVAGHSARSERPEVLALLPEIDRLNANNLQVIRMVLRGLLEQQDETSQAVNSNGGGHHRAL
jgi:transcriptional regulator with XRE-family HTH domain